jgi:Na+-driven multidrug efflux pump
MIGMEVEVAMRKSVRVRFWIETIVGAVTGVLFLVTLIHPDWLEAFGWDPDQHSGAVEWLIVAGLFVLTVVLFSAARGEWRRAPAAAVQQTSR